ncbi:MAG: beta-propeller fold lactonase family protein [Chthoniobacteraceae bacterium]
MKPFLVLITALSTAALAAVDSASSAPLDEVHTIETDSLAGVTSVAISPDGRFLYSAAFFQGTVATFQRNPETGELVQDDVITAPNLNAAVSISLSRDGAHAVVSAFQANAITLFSRDAETGRLTQRDAVSEGEDGASGLNFVVRGVFSKDGRFIYTASSGGIGVFEIVDNQLKFIQIETAEGQLQGMRDIRLSPDGKTIYAAGTVSNSLAVLHPDPETGKLQTVQTFNNQIDDLPSLGGVFYIACSPDGKNVYTNSGRFGGENAVSVFEVLEAGELKFIEAHTNGVDGFDGFVGGNGIGVSPDGRMVYALATISDQMARFSRDQTTGKLTLLGLQSVGPFSEQGSATLCVSPDGKFIYVADESSSAIVVFAAPKSEETEAASPEPPPPGQ